MHNLFLGTAKTMLKKVWLEKKLITDHQFELIQTRVDAMTVPNDIGRVPRKSLSSFSGFTAEQWEKLGPCLLFEEYYLTKIISAGNHLY